MVAVGAVVVGALLYDLALALGITPSELMSSLPSSTTSGDKA